MVRRRDREAGTDDKKIPSAKRGYRNHPLMLDSFLVWLSKLIDLSIYDKIWLFNTMNLTFDDRASVVRQC